MIGLAHYLIVAAILFTSGVLGIFLKQEGVHAKWALASRTFAHALTLSIGCDR